MDPSQSSSMFTFDDTSRIVTQPQFTPIEYSSGYVSQPLIETERVKVIWGTTINVQECSELFKDFLRTFECDGVKIYLEKINDLIEMKRNVYSIDCEHLPNSLKTRLKLYPQELIPVLDNAINEMINEITPNFDITVRIRPSNIGEKLNIRNIDPKQIDRIVYVKGIVTKVSNVMPDICRACYRCVNCQKRVIVENIRGIINEPTSCECGSKFSYEMVPNKCEYMDRQVVKVQDVIDTMTGGYSPIPITVILTNDQVDSLVPGDKVKVIGILQVSPLRLNDKSRKVKRNFRIHLEMLSCQHLDLHKECGFVNPIVNTRHDIPELQMDGLGEREDDISNKENVNVNVKGSGEPTEKRAYALKSMSGGDMLSRIERLKNDPDVYEILARMIAPSVYGMDNVKKALLLQLFGGVRKSFGSMKLRGDINVLLAGDPGISKSQLLSFVHKVCNRGIYTSGRGSSAVGLSATVKRDVDTQLFVLEPGALVLSDNGVCCIDEFDKMSDSTRSVLHEVMEQQTVTVAKAGIITTLNARCSILASCNPIESKYNTKKSIIENIDLPPTLISRFDVVCLLIDKSDPENDEIVGNHILNMYSGIDNTESDIDLLKAYVSEGRKINPLLSKESVSLLRDEYCSLRQLDDGRTVTATTRQLESLIRLSEAHARMRLSGVVEVCDVEEAVRMIKEGLLLYAVDPLTGKIDMDLITTGRSAQKKKLLEALMSEILKCLSKPSSVSEIALSTGASEFDVNEAIRALEIDERVFLDRRTGIVEKVSERVPG